MDKNPQFLNYVIPMVIIMKGLRKVGKLYEFKSSNKEEGKAWLLKNTKNKTYLDFISMRTKALG